MANKYQKFKKFELMIVKNVFKDIDPNLFIRKALYF